jgi:hypoxanthine phosphoribosyltransferase
LKTPAKSDPGDLLIADDDIRTTRETADRLYSASDIEAAMDRMGGEIGNRLRRRNPLMLAVMTGGMFPAGMLLTRLDFPLQVDYIHLSRYGDRTSGGDIEWIRRPPPTVAGRTVLLVDDLLDQGVTLQAAVDCCRDNGAAEVVTAVLLVKAVTHRTGLEATDFFGLTAPDRYVFGSGMDYKNYWRNCPGIFAVKD